MAGSGLSERRRPADGATERGGPDLGDRRADKRVTPADRGPVVAEPFSGIVTRIERDKVAAVVEVQCGPHRLVSLMTAEAVEELGLAIGDEAVCAVKATNVVVEVPG